MGGSVWIGPVIVAAAIAALINVAGWFVTFRQTQSLERARRNEKVIDVQTALLAEIRSDLVTLEGIDVAREINATRARLAAEQPYTPFVPKDSGAPIFAAVVNDITVLPTEVIDPVVLYYKLREAIAHFAEDLRADSFRRLPTDRKLAMMEDYFRMKAHAGKLAGQAVLSLEWSLGLPVNNRASGPSDPGSASEVSASGQASSTPSLSQYRRE